MLNGKDESLLLVKPNERHGRLLMKEWEKWSERNEETIRTEGSKSKLQNFGGSISTNSRLWRYYPSDCIWNYTVFLSTDGERRMGGSRKVFV